MNTRSTLEQLHHDLPILLAVLIILILAAALWAVDRNRRKKPVKVCAWCFDKPRLEAKAALSGRPVTHGICRPCKRRVLAQLPWK